MHVWQQHHCNIGTPSMWYQICIFCLPQVLPGPLQLHFTKLWLLQRDIHSQKLSSAIEFPFSDGTSKSNVDTDRTGHMSSSISLSLFPSFPPPLTSLIHHDTLAMTEDGEGWASSMGISSLSSDAEDPSTDLYSTPLPQLSLLNPN